MSKCSATCKCSCSILWSATGFRRSKLPATPPRRWQCYPPPLPKSQDKCYMGGALLGGCSRDTPATHSKLKRRPAVPLWPGVKGRSKVAQDSARDSLSRRGASGTTSTLRHLHVKIASNQVCNHHLSNFGNYAHDKEGQNAKKPLRNMAPKGTELSKKHARLLRVWIASLMPPLSPTDPQTSESSKDTEKRFKGDFGTKHECWDPLLPLCVHSMEVFLHRFVLFWLSFSCRYDVERNVLGLHELGLCDGNFWPNMFSVNPPALILSKNSGLSLAKTG